jgi:ABC-type nitrate/sulfonate/bicarbonate transport system substrate-binding protein
MRRIILALALALALAAPAAARPALPPEPTEVGTVGLGDGAYVVSWVQRSNAATVLFAAHGFAVRLNRAPAHRVVIPASVGWAPGDAVTIIEDWSGEEPSHGEIYTFAPRPRQLYLPGLSR